MTWSAIVVGTVLAACSSSDTTATGCDSSKCLPGNTCIEFEGETKCRKTCSSNADPSTSCPFNYTCFDPQTGVPPFCRPDTALRDDGLPLEKKDVGQWGSKCQANLGVENPACDVDQGFYCYGIAPTDGDAYCTRYNCEKDSDCAAGFWCATVNRTPNVETAERKTIGEVMNVCLRRTYCATCQVDLDCPPFQGRAQYCIEDVNGGRFCAPECDSKAACPNEARCVDVGLDVNVCYPRANTCVGDGSLCSPCRSDADCGEDGACVKGQYTTEKSCAKKSTKSCKGSDGKPTQGSCPTKLTEKPESQVRCLGAVFEEVPEDYCHGIYRIGAEEGDIGCWTPNRNVPKN